MFSKQSRQRWEQAVMSRLRHPSQQQKGHVKVVNLKKEVQAQSYVFFVRIPTFLFTFLSGLTSKTCALQFVQDWLARTFVDHESGAINPIRFFWLLAVPGRLQPAVIQVCCLESVRTALDLVLIMKVPHNDLEGNVRYAHSVLALPTCQGLGLCQCFCFCFTLLVYFALSLKPHAPVLFMEEGLVVFKRSQLPFSHTIMALSSTSSIIAGNQWEVLLLPCSRWHLRILQH